MKSTRLNTIATSLWIIIDLYDDDDDDYDYDYDDDDDDDDDNDDDEMSPNLGHSAVDEFFLFVDDRRN